MKKRQPFVITSLMGVVFSLVVCVTPLKAQITFLFTVNTTSDTVVPNACVNGLAGCSLRGAMEAANSMGASTIVFAIPASDPFCAAGACTINLSSELPLITVNTEFDGPGADKLTVKPATGGIFGVFRVGNTVTVFFIGMTISNGFTFYGSGINNTNNGSVSVINCTVSGNKANRDGGGLLNVGTMAITNSTISGNTAGLTNGLGGGGIYNVGIMQITNSTINGNTCVSSGCNGGGIYNTGTVSVTNSTISSNTLTLGSGSGGGIYNGSGHTANIKNSISALNTTTAAGPDVSGNFVSAGFNLVGKTDGSAGFNSATDLTGTTASPLNPGLDPSGLQNNGGPTKTIALSISSPAVDKGTSLGLTGALTSDQRGAAFPRSFDHPATPNAAGGDGADIGAFELGAVIAGTVTYGNAVGAPTPRFVSNVIITAAGSLTVMTTTAAPGATAGQYSLTGFGTGSFTITPTKTGGVNGITSFDAAKIAQHVSGTSTLTGNALLVADVSGNGIVSSFDAAQIAAFVSSGSGMQTGMWKFIPVNRPYSSVTSDLTGEDYTALLMGEVSGNWTNTGARPANGFDPNALYWLVGL